MLNGVTDKDKGFDATLKRLAGKARVRVGVLSDVPKTEEGSSSGGATLLEIAATHEFGAPAANIPQRSFIRATVEMYEGRIKALQGHLAKRIVAGEITAAQGVEQIGAFVQGLVQERIAAGIAPPNAQSTIERKGSATPLIDSGQLRSSITYKTEKV